MSDAKGVCACGPDAGCARAADGWRCVQCGLLVAVSQRV